MYLLLNYGLYLPYNFCFYLSMYCNPTLYYYTKNVFKLVLNKIMIIIYEPHLYYNIFIHIWLQSICWPSLHYVRRSARRRMLSY